VKQHGYVETLNSFSSESTFVGVRNDAEKKEIRVDVGVAFGCVVFCDW
jgi:hypothetical protein